MSTDEPGSARDPVPETSNEDDHLPKKNAAVHPSSTAHGQDGGTISRLMIPKQNCEYGSKEYWEARFAEEQEYEWLLSYQQLASQLQPFLARNPSCCRILIVGCGNSPFSADLYDAGHRNILNLDYSATVIAAMKERHGARRPEMEWIVGDMTDMSNLADDDDDASFDVIIDKAAMDALVTKEGDVWNPDETVVAASRSMCRHISRLLVPGGVFLQVSLAQPHFRSKYLLGWHGSDDETDKSDDAYSREFQWSLRVEKAGNDSKADCFGHYLYIMTKDDK